MTDELIQRLVGWATGKPQGPVSIHLDPTNRCDLQCRFCWQRSHERFGWLDRRHELPEAKLLEIVRDAALLGVTDWLISGGGEPFVRLETTTRVMVEIKKWGMRGDIITNGTLLNELCVKKIVRAGWDDMRFSVNAPIERVHDFMVGRRGAFRQVMRNIRLTQRVKKELGADRPKVGFNTVITSRNYFLFPQLVELLHQLGGEMLNVQTIILYDKVEKVWSLNEEQRADSIKYFRAAVKACRQYGIRTNLASYAQPDIIEKTTEMDRIVDLGRRELRRVKPAHPFLHTFCYEPFYLVTIRANGTVGSCRLFGDEGDNIHTKSFRQIWFGDYFSAARKTLLRGPQPFCSKCGSNEMLEQQRIRVELSRVLN